MKKNFSIMLVLTVLLTMLLAGCSAPTQESAPATDGTTSTADASAPTTDGEALDTISVITREDGSGTRGAFVEITGVMSDDVDNTTVNAIVHDGTGKVMTAVANDPSAIGYISLGSLNDTVKALSVDGVEATGENVASGDYKLARPFNLATLKGAEPDLLVQEFIDFMMSAEGQTIVADNGFIAVEAGESITSQQMEGEIMIGGSTSVTPLMEKFKEAYEVINPNATINIESIGSTGGMNGASEGTFDIGMASRELKDSEMEVLDPIVVAQDGIAMVVNLSNPLSNITMEEIMGVYTESITSYADLQG